MTKVAKAEIAPNLNYPATVGELIDELAKFPRNLPIKTLTRNGAENVGAVGVVPVVVFSDVSNEHRAGEAVVIEPLTLAYFKDGYLRTFRTRP